VAFISHSRIIGILACRLRAVVFSCGSSICKFDCDCAPDYDGRPVGRKPSWRSAYRRSSTSIRGRICKQQRDLASDCHGHLGLVFNFPGSGSIHWKRCC